MPLANLQKKLTVPDEYITERDVKQMIGKLDLSNDEDRKVARDWFLDRGKAANAKLVGRHQSLSFHFGDYLFRIKAHLTRPQEDALLGTLLGERPWTSLPKHLREFVVRLLQAQGHHAAVAGATNPQTGRKIQALTVDGRPVTPRRAKVPWLPGDADIAKWKRQQREKLAEGMPARRPLVEV